MCAQAQCIALEQGMANFSPLSGEFLTTEDYTSQILYSSNKNRPGFSMQSLIVAKNVTASRPSIKR